MPSKTIDVWVLSIEDCGSPAESWVFNTNKEAVDKMRDWFRELAVRAYGILRDYDDLDADNIVDQITNPALQIDSSINAHAQALTHVESILPQPDTELVADVPWDDRVVWLEKHTLTLAARTEYEVPAWMRQG